MHRIRCEEDEMDCQHRRLFAAMMDPGNGCMVLLSPSTYCD